MAKSLTLRYVIWAQALMVWSAVVYAAETDKFVTGVEAIPFEAFKYVLIIAVVSGTAATLTKITKLDSQGQLPRYRSLTLEIVKDVVCSLAAGVLAFFATSWIKGIDFWLQAIVIFMAGYGGSRFLEAVFSDGFTPALGNFFNRVLGRPSANAPRNDSPP